MNSEGNLVYLDWLIGGRVALDELWQLKRYNFVTSECYLLILKKMISKSLNLFSHMDLLYNNIK